jgi:hypothetical protein
MSSAQGLLLVGLLSVKEDPVKLLWYEAGADEESRRTIRINSRIVYTKNQVDWKST